MSATPKKAKRVQQEQQAAAPETPKASSAASSFLTGGSERPRKRRAVTIESVPKPSESSGPFLAPLPASSRDSFFEGKHVFHGFQRTDESNGDSNDCMLIADMDKTIFVATNFGPQIEASKGLSNYAVGVYDPQTRVVKLVDATVLGLTTEVKALRNEQLPKSNQQSYFAAKNLLGETFGTKKVKQAIRAIERNQVDVKALKPIAGLIEDTIAVKAEEMPSIDDLNAEMELDRPIPPYNAEADSVDDVYSFDEIISPEEMDQLPIKTFLKLTKEELDDLRTNKRYPEFVLNHLERVVTQTKRNKKLLKQLLYLSYLIRFRGGRRFDDEEKVAYQLGHNVPQPVMARLYSKFLDKVEDPNTGSVSYSMSPRKKDLLTSYLLVLCLFIEGDYTLDPSAIGKDLKLERTKVLGYLRNLGCSLVAPSARNSTEIKEEDQESGVNNSSRGKVARLQLPLNFPKPKRGSAKR